MAKIVQTINRIKKELDKDSASITFAQLKPGIKIDKAEIDQIGVYAEFLEVTNGARFGDIDFWSFDNLKRNQFVLQDRKSGKQSLIAIGQILYEPLILDINNQSVYSFKQDDDPDTPMFLIGDFDHFLSDYVFGEKYCEIIPECDADDWILLLKKIKIIN